jgi:hypothetical protein
MQFRIIAALVMAEVSFAGQSTTPDLHSVIQQFRDAVAANDLEAAAHFAANLDHAVQEKYRAALTKDAETRLAEALTWFSPDTESILVQQVPVFVHSADSLPTLAAGPLFPYTTSILFAVDHGELYKKLDGQVIRLVVGGVSKIGRWQGGIPGPMPDSEAAFLFYLSQPLDPALLGPAKVELWYGLARPDVLVVATKRKVLSGVLERSTHAEGPRALPDSLPEWAAVDRTASVWGLRHYANPGSSEDSSNPLSNFEASPPSDPQAVGVTIQFYSETKSVEIRYLGESEGFPLPSFRDISNQFTVDHPRKGMSRLTANLRERGAFPLHASMHLLGFGSIP